MISALSHLAFILSYGLTNDNILGIIREHFSRRSILSKKRRKRSTSETVMIVMSAFLVGTMVLSGILIALPGPPAPTATPWPTWTPLPPPTMTPLPTEPPPTELPRPTPTGEATQPPVGPELPTDTPTLEATELPVGPDLPTDTPTQEATEPPVGPELPTATATVTPTLTITPTDTPTVTPTGALPQLTFAVCGDSRDNPRVYRQVLETVTAGGSEFLIHTGDLVNRGTEAQWQEFKETMAGFALPFYPVPGNHDGLDGELDGFLAHSGAPAAHYSFDRGPVHFTLVDSHQGGITAAEQAWLREDLSATGQPIKMVFLHHPPFDPDGTDHIMAFGNEPFMALMVEQGVDYVFAGHIHAYAQEERDGVLYIITGGAGAPLYAGDHPQAFHHYLSVTVEGEEVAIEVIEV
jgi:predicted phosphodiesterase